MKIEVDTEIEEISELKASIAILEDAINRRENINQEEEETENKVQEPIKPEISQQSSFESAQEPIKQPEPVSQPEPAPEVDMSPLSMSDYGQKNENRTIENISQQDNKSIVKEIITDLAKNTSNKPIQMSDIIQKSSGKNISDEETRRLVNELKDSGEI